MESLQELHLCFRRLKAHKNLVKRKTIENKYFRPPATASILTWRAKEQIRYLHAEDPDEGGIHTILETFPITEPVSLMVQKRQMPLYSAGGNKACKTKHPILGQTPDMFYEESFSLIEFQESLCIHSTAFIVQSKPCLIFIQISTCMCMCLK